MPRPPADPDRTGTQEFVRTAAAQAGLTLQPHHVAGVTEHFARLAGQAEALLAFPLDEGEEPAPVYRP